ncbi:MAG: ester cyclase [Burkholderiales bacterium]
MTTTNLGRRATTVATTLAAPTVAAAGHEPALLKANRELVIRYFEEVWNQGKLDVLDELIAGDYVNHSSSTPNPRPGPADLKPIVAEMRRGIAALKYEILDMVVGPDKVAVYVRMTGTHSGTLFGMKPSGGRIDVRQMQFERIEDGRIVEHWRLTDDLSLMKQMGQI